MDQMLRQLWASCRMPTPRQQFQPCSHARHSLVGLGSRTDVNPADRFVRVPNAKVFSTRCFFFTHRSFQVCCDWHPLLIFDQVSIASIKQYSRSHNASGRDPCQARLRMPRPAFEIFRVFRSLSFSGPASTSLRRPTSLLHSLQTRHLNRSCRVTPCLRLIGPVSAIQVSAKPDSHPPRKNKHVELLDPQSHARRYLRIGN